MDKGLLWETFVNNTEFHSQMPLQTLPCRKDALCSPHPEAASTSLGSEPSGMDHEMVEMCMRPISIPDLRWKKWTP